MNFGLQAAYGFCFGIGFIVAAFLMKALLHIGIMG